MDSEWEQKLLVRLREFVGKDRYDKYVKRAAMGRLQWWQEREWVGFVSEHPEFVVSSTHLLRILQRCPLHGTSLQSDHITIRAAPADDSYFEAAQQVDFPFAKSGWVSSHRIVQVDEAEDVLFCQDCRSVEAGWLESEGRSVMPTDWLLERVDLADMAEHVERMLTLGLALGGRDKVNYNAYAWQEKRAWFLSRQEPDAELWTFQNPAPSHYPLSGGTGLAWVREREVYHALYVVIARATVRNLGPTPPEQGAG